MVKPVLGYWNFRGMAEPIRYLLHYKKVDFEDKQYTSGGEDWEKEKFDLGLDFPHLPYYIDGDIKLTQSVTILRYLAKKYELDGKNDHERYKIYMVEQQSVDLWKSLRSVVMSNDYEILRKEFLENIPEHFKCFEEFLRGKNYLVGEDITYVDFMVFESLDFYTTFHGTALDDFRILKAYWGKMKKLPELQFYVNSCKRNFEPIPPRPKFEGPGPQLILKKPINPSLLF
ncbi:glutathione S-transferase-like [Argiope bruennichi]|uniref:glutathione S-transferase-like n=1 Tax=Argiope bruennichi TaxID=94029 RepID=UPI0024949C47|nr:glutathione S-transferase-like [Argiope bruennichi]